MARWFRSEHMEYISLIVNEDAAHDCLADLGKLSAIQFTDVSLIAVVGAAGGFAVYELSAAAIGWARVQYLLT